MCSKGCIVVVVIISILVAALSSYFGISVSMADNKHQPQHPGWLPIVTDVDDHLYWSVVTLPKSQLGSILPKDVEFDTIPEPWGKLIPADHHLLSFEHAFHQNSTQRSFPIFHLNFHGFKYQIPWVKHKKYGGPLNYKPLELQDNLFATWGTELSYAVTTKLVHMNVDFQLGNWAIQPLKDSIDTSFTPTVTDFKKVTDYSNFKLYEAINAQPFFDKNLDKCGVDYHIWDEGTSVRPVTMKLEVKGGVLPTIDKDTTFQTKGIDNDPFGAVEVKTRVHISEAVNAEKALKHPAEAATQTST
jgi:hypothetical protein